MVKITGQELVDKVDKEVASGLSLKEACKKFQSLPGKYYFWKNKLKGKKNQPSHQTIELVGEKSDFSELRLLMRMLTDAIERLEK